MYIYVCKCIGKVWKEQAILLIVVEPEIGEGVRSGVGEEAQRNFPFCPVDYCVVWIFHNENVSMYHLGS